MCNKINNGPVTSQLLPDTQRLVANKANGQLIQNGERHFRLYFSKDKKKMSICFAADCNNRCLRERCRIFRFPAAEKEFKTWGKACRRVTFRSIAAYMNGLKCQV